MPAIALGLLASTALVAPSAHAIGVGPTSDAFGLANTLFLDFGRLTVTGTELSGAFGQAGTYTDASGTCGLPNSGIVLSTGNVADYADGPNNVAGKTTPFGTNAMSARQELLGPITGSANITMSCSSTSRSTSMPTSTDQLLRRLRVRGVPGMGQQLRQ